MELNETVPFSFNDILDCHPPSEGIPRDFKVSQSSLGYSYFRNFFFRVKFFLVFNHHLSKSSVHLKLPLSNSLPNYLNFLLCLSQFWIARKMSISKPRFDVRFYPYWSNKINLISQEILLLLIVPQKFHLINFL